MLAVNGKVSGYCVHLPVCNLQTVKSTEKVSRLRKSPLWEQLLPSTCLSEMPFSPSRCPCPRSLELESMWTTPVHCKGLMNKNSRLGFSPNISLIIPTEWPYMCKKFRNKQNLKLLHFPGIWRNIEIFTLH